MTHPPTPEQSAIISEVASHPTSVMIRAYAGCAKTSTLEMAAPGIRTPALALAFNRKIAQELTPRLPSHFTVKTLNGFGHGVWARHCQSRGSATSLKLDDRKLGKLVTAIAKDNRVNLPSWQWDAVRQLVSKAMLAGILPSGSDHDVLREREQWHDCDEISPEEDFDLTYDLARQVLITSNNLSLQGHISFDDQVYCPVVFQAAFPKYPVVFVDESQDLSPLNHAMLSRCIRDRLVAVGDPLQAIYAFRGADSSSMDTMRGLASNWTDLRLTLTFRCPKTIVSRQQQHAPGFTAYQSNAEGKWMVFPSAFGDPDDTPEEAAVKDHWKWSHITSYAGEISATSIAILCRNNAPLLSLAFKLLRRGIGCQMLGRDIGRGLTSITQRLCPDDSLPITRAMSAIRDWAERETSLALTNDKPARADRITDQHECLVAVAEGSSCQTAGDLRAMLVKLFSRDNDPIVLSTIHRAKGLEWPLVIHLDPWRIPSRQARAAGGAALQQENNLRYVCETRTKHTLIHANLEDFR